VEQDLLGRVLDGIPVFVKDAWIDYIDERTMEKILTEGHSQVCEKEYAKLLYRYSLLY